jgi:hypothetical protein
MRSALALVTSLALTAACPGAQGRPDAVPPRVTKDVRAPEAGRPVPTSVEAVARAVEVDHVFLATRPGAPEAAALRAAGLHVPEQPMRHTGGGTASLSVLFENAYLELLYPDSTAGDGASSPAERAHWRRVFGWRESGASPIGVGLRRLAGGPDSLPFPTERMAPQPWMPPGMEMHLVTTAADSMAPGVFVVPRGMALTGWIDRVRRDTARAPMLQHPLGVRRVTGVRVVVTRPDAMPPNVRLLRDAGVLQVEQGAGPLVELTFDGGSRGATKDLRPELPLLIRY